MPRKSNAKAIAAAKAAAADLAKFALPAAEVESLAPGFKDLVEGKVKIENGFNKLYGPQIAFEEVAKKGDEVIVAYDEKNSFYLKAKVTSVDRDSFEAGMGDGAIIRVKVGNWSFRVSGVHNFWPIGKAKVAA